MVRSRGSRRGLDHPCGSRLLTEARPDLGVAERFARHPAFVLRALGLRPLSEDQSRDVAATILAAMKQPNIVSSDLPALAQALQAVDGKFAAADKEAATGLILAAMNQMTYPDWPQKLAQTLQALNAKLTPEQATAAIDQMLKARQPSPWISTAQRGGSAGDNEDTPSGVHRPADD